MATATALGFSLFSTWDPKGARQARKDLTGLQKVTRDLGQASQAIFGGAALGVAAYTAALLKAGIASNDLQQRSNAALKTTLGSAQAAGEQMQKLREFGKGSPIQLPVWIKAQQQMLAFGVETGKVVPLLGAVQDAVIAAGGTEEEIKGVVRALSQMQSKGKLSAEELNQIGERGIDAAGVVAQAFGTTAEDIRARITQGTISVDDFFDGFIKGSEMAFGGAAELAKQTFSGMIDRLKGAHRRIGEILATPLVDPEGGGALVELGNALADAMNEFEDALRPVVDILARQLDPAVQRSAEGIRKFGESITTDKMIGFINTVRDGLPVLSALSAMLTAKLASGFLELVPGMQRFAGAMSPVIFGIGALAAASPEFRSALAEVGEALAPLVPLAAELATTVATVLAKALQVVVPILEVGASAVLLITDNLGIALPLVLAVGAALYYMAAAQGVNTAATFAAAIGVTKLKESFVALRTAMIAHPILAAAAIVGTLTGIALALSDVGGEAQEMSTEFQSALTEINTATASELGQVAAQFDELERNITVAWGDRGFLERAKMGVQDFFSSPFGGGGQEVNEQVKAWTDAANAIDETVAAMVRSGEIGSSTAEIQAYLNDRLNITSSEYDRMSPLLDEIAAAQFEAAQETQALADAVGNATAGIQGFYSELKAQTDPYFGLINATQKYNEELAKYNEVASDTSSTQAELDAANLSLMNALMAMTIAGEEAGAVLGETLPADLLAAAQAAGVPESAISELERIWSESSQGIIQSNNNLVSSSASAASQAAASLGLLSTETADKASTIASSLQTVAANGGSVSTAFDEMARRSGMSKQGVVDAMLAMREAGFDFATEIDAYLDSAGDSASSMAATTKTAGENMATYLQGISDKDAAVASSSDDMARRHNANMNAMDGSTNNHIDSMIDRFNDMIGKSNGLGGIVKALAGTWRGAMSSMQQIANTAWTSIKKSIERPVNFVVGTLYNDGLVNMWNRVSAAMFGNKGRLSTVRGFASGGHIRGPGTGTSDSIPARLSNGEYVVRAAAVQKYGVGTLDALNNMQVEQPRGFFLGGLVDLAGKGISKTFNWLNDNAKPDWMSGVFDIMGSVDKMIDGMKSKFFNIPADTNSKKFRDMLASGAKTIWSRVTKVWETVTGALGGMGGGPGGYQQMFQWIKGIVPGTQLTSGFRQGDPGYHGRGMAVDLAFSDGSERRGGGKAETAYNAIKRAWMAGIAELIWDYSPDGYGVGVWNGRRHKFNSASSRPPSHNDHIHWAQSGSGGGGGGSAGGWSHVATAALKAAGLFSSSNLANVLRAIQKESSGNPRAVNNWDINARNGTPSKGLLQTIDPTFYAYAGKYRGRGPFDPFANIYAAARYASSRYGSGWSARMARPGGYAAGGAVSYDSGGMLQPGYTLAYNGTGKPEPVGHDLKGSTTVNIDMRGAVIANERQFEDMVVKAMTKASEKNRLRNIKVKR